MYVDDKNCVELVEFGSPCMYTINASNLNTRWAIGADLDAVCHGMNI